ncbi:hypothetical protein NliqN6_4328 [Naganishia liquefaciens]|uniref:Sulfhydryl oxidase n=1 Tax=Naganishia liquefaciens TaxID=104408 RepID=A0A8H3YHT5_9TREE|nr:hypothetical protein NliqN6_4328 [Naganishia liquefaciens]
MLPRFLKTFLLASLLLIVPTLFILYQKRSGGTEWNEWSLTYGTWDSWDVNQKPSSDIEGRHDSALYFEDHWNAGGAAPDYQSTRIVDADREEEPNGAWVYRIGETVISIDELEAYRQWKESRRNEAPFSKEEMPSSADAWQDDSVVLGNVIMPKLGNATAKAELGRAAWKLLHLVTLKYPEEPTTNERAALKSYFHLFARLYPCGECAAEFQALLKEYPPQTSSRKSASLWLCSIHNMVNARLGKPEFDCLTLDATYDCGCAEDDPPASIQAD